MEQLHPSPLLPEIKEMLETTTDKELDVLIEELHQAWIVAIREKRERRGEEPVHRQPSSE